jgi:hypothetical protein
VSSGKTSPQGIGIMNLHLDLVLPALLIATAGLGPALPETSSTTRAGETCTIDDRRVGATRLEAEQRIFAEGYTEISSLAKGCDGSWHALALAAGDPVIVQVTLQGTVVTE